MPRTGAILIAVVQLAISVSLLVWAWRHVDISAVESRLGQMRYTYAAAALALLLVQAVLAAERWRLISAEFNFVSGTLWHFRATMVSQFFGQVLPATLGGDGYRLWSVLRAGQGYKAAILCVMADRLVGVLALLVLSAVSLPLLFARLGPDTTAGWSLMTVIAGGIGGFVVLGIVGRLAARGVPSRWLRILLAPATALSVLLAHRRQFVLQALLGLGAHLCAVVVMLLVAKAIGIRFSLVEALVVVPPVILVISLPISIAGWGVRESAMIFGLGLFGLPSGEAVILSVSFGLASFLMGMIGAGFWIPYSRRSLLR